MGVILSWNVLGYTEKPVKGSSFGFAGRVYNTPDEALRL